MENRLRPSLIWDDVAPAPVPWLSYLSGCWDGAAAGRGEVPGHGVGVLTLLPGLHFTF